MSANPFLRGFDKLSIQLIVHELQPGSSLHELSYVIHAKDQDQSLVLGVQPTLEQAHTSYSACVSRRGNSVGAG